MRFRTQLVAALTLLAASSNAAAAGAAREPAALQPRIVSGTIAGDSWPAQGHLRLQTSEGAYVCGGTLVSGRWFLTAGHCATDADGAALPASAFQITLGKTDLTTAVAGDRYSVGIAIRHPQYSRHPDYDLALLRITSATAPPQRPLRLVAPTEQALWSPGTSATIIGWGSTCSTCSTSTKLLQAAVPLVSDATCDRANRAALPLPTNLIPPLGR